MKKVFFLIGTLSNGGAERVVSNISLSLKSDIESKMVLFGNESKIDYPYKGEIIKLDSKRSKGIINKLTIFKSRISNINRIKKENYNDTIISFLEYPNLLNLLTKKNKKTIISVRNHMSTKHKTGIKALFWNKTIKSLYGKADLIIAVSEEIKLDLIKTYGLKQDNIKVIYNSYPIDEIKGLASEVIEEEYKSIFDYPVIITSGRLNKQKGQWHLLRSFKKVKQVIPNAKLVILGDGGMKEYLYNLASELNIERDVHFLGFQKNPFKYIAKSKVFVLSSLNEGFPNALAEAMICGIPVISSDCLSGPREILAPEEFGLDQLNYDIDKDRYGILVPVCDGNRYSAKDVLTKEEYIMAEAIINVMSNDELSKYFSKKSLVRMNDFDIKNILKEWESII